MRYVKVEVRWLDEDATEWLPVSARHMAGYECSALVGLDASGKVVEVVGTDGGDPEDQTLYRDWAWVGNVLNAALADVERQAGQLAEAATALAAIREDLRCAHAERDALRAALQELVDSVSYDGLRRQFPHEGRARLAYRAACEVLNARRAKR